MTEKNTKDKHSHKVANVRKPKRGNKGGGLDELPSGKWRWRVSVGTDDLGHQLRVTGTARNKTEAEQAMTAARAAHSGGMLAAPNRQTFGSLIDRWLAARTLEVAPSTAIVYKTYLDAYVPDTLRRVRLQDLTPNELRKLNKNLTEKSNLSAATRQKLFSLLRAALRQAVEERVLIFDPAANIRIVTTQAEQQRKAARRQALRPEDLAKLLKAAEGHPQYAGIYLLYALGLRRGEMLGLHWTAVDFEQKTIYIHQQVRLVGNIPELGPLKNVPSVRTLRMMPDVERVLRDQFVLQADQQLAAEDLWNDTGLVVTSEVGTALHPRRVNRIFADLTTLAGIPHQSSHNGQRTAASALLRSGEDLDVAAALLGHGNGNVPRESYRSVLEDEKRQAAFDLTRYLASGGQETPKVRVKLHVKARKTA